METPAPVIGIVTRALSVPFAIVGDNIDTQGVFEYYLTCLQRAGAATVLIPYGTPEEILRAAYERIDGLLIAGGEDVVPSSSTRAARQWGEPSPKRTITEERLLSFTIEDRKPVFGICRGLQLINYYSGGTLIADIAKEAPALGIPTAINHCHLKNKAALSEHAHTVHIEKKSRLHQILGETLISVNSIHHQAVLEVGDGLAVSATAPDGIIEAVESTETAPHHWLALQWHPEMLEDDVNTERLFASFVQDAAAFRGRSQSVKH